MGGGMGGPAQPASEEKKEGVAEAAPKTPGLLPTTPALPPPKGRRKRWKLLEMEGYFRLRTDWFKNFHLGFTDDPTLGGAPFPRALSCSRTGAGCDNALSSTNMRLRLEPVFNIDEGTSIHVQADVFDNLVLGSTPMNQDYSGVYSDINQPPLGAFTVNEGQGAPIANRNSDRDSLTIKRAWAEVAVPLGILKFGRQPNHWGMGMWNNSGAFDPISGNYDYDGDYGDNVDRVSFSAVVPGTSLRAMIASDWNSTALVSNQTSTGIGREGHPYDLEDGDDSNSWVGVISKMDSPQEFRDSVDRGDLAFNWGVYFEYKTQKWDTDLESFTLGSTPDPQTQYVPRNLKTYSPDLWVKLGVGNILLEGEFGGHFGNLNSIDDQGISGEHSIRSLGGVGRLTWKGVEGKLRLGIEGGYASGDQWDAKVGDRTVEGVTNIAYANQLGDPNVCNAQSSCTYSRFMFDREYKVDMIMWRHLFGAVTNAIYAKPFLSYDLTKSIMFKVANITSFANKPIATPGNSEMYGTEFNGDLGYNGHRLFAGISYGVLFPFGAMSHPANPTGTTGTPPFGYGPDANNNTNVGDGGTAHSIQMRLILGF